MNKYNLIKKISLSVIFIMIFSGVIPLVICSKNDGLAKIENAEIISKSSTIRPNTVLSYQFFKDPEAITWVFNVNANDTVEIYLVTQTGKDILLSNNGTFVDDLNLISKINTRKGAFQITDWDQNTMWMVIKNPSNNSIYFDLEFFSNQNQSKLENLNKLVIILSIFLVVIACITAYLYISRENLLNNQKKPYQSSSKYQKD